MARQELTREQARLTALMKGILQKQRDLEGCRRQLDAGKKFWGTPGPYLRKTFLLVLVEELGTDDVLDGG